MHMPDLQGERVLRVAITEFPPFVEKRHKHYAGFEIELWEAVAQMLHLRFQYRLQPLEKLIQGVSLGVCDIGIAGISKSEPREEMIDYTHTTYKSGLSILIRKRQDVRMWSSLRHLVHQSRKQLAQLAVGLTALIGASAHIFWWFERGRGAFHADYAQGIGEAIWFMFESVTTVGYGDYVPVTFYGRAIAVLLIVVGYSLFALLITQLSTLFIAEKLVTTIHDAEDLCQKRVVTVRGTIAEYLLDKYRPDLSVVDTFSEALNALERGSVDAFVFDTPVLQHHLRKHKTKTFRLVGARFEEHDYAFVVPEKSGLLEPINRALLTLIETGEYNVLYKKWFGS